MAHFWECRFWEARAVFPGCRRFLDPHFPPSAVRALFLYGLRGALLPWSRVGIGLPLIAVARLLPQKTERAGSSP